MTHRTPAMALLILIGAVVTNNLQAAQSHPFLICKRSQFTELRQRARQEPWASMKTNALVAIEQDFDPANPISLHRYVGACALTYILDTDKSADCAIKVRDAILKLDKTGFDPSRAWSGTVAQMGAAFVCILALDIVYDDLSPQGISACEAMIEKCIAIIERTGSWPSARYGTHGTWDIYTGKRTTPDDAFYDYCMIQMTEDGVSAVSPGYAFARMGAGDDRPQKSAYADVLEFTGIDRRYYGNERFQKFYRWLFSGCVTPAKDYQTFGDVSPRWKPANNLLMWRVGRFDRKAAAYLAWLMKGESPRGHILSYILMTEPLPEPIVPQSQLAMNGAAVFRERPDSPLSLSCMLYNIASNAEWHTHEEANAVSCSAYGVRLLTNGGWLGDPMRPAYKNNTLAINGQRHEKRMGAGLTEGLLCEDFDYACGDSGEAMGESKSFQRSLLLVHEQDKANGYFVIVDEVEADAGDMIHSYLQAATTSPLTEVSARREYNAQINHHSRVDGVELSVFYATKPASVGQEFIESGSPTRDPKSGKHYRLEAVYPADNTGKCQIVSLLFPHDAKHRKADMTAIAKKSTTGVTVDLGNGVQDCILASGQSGDVEYQGLRFQAKFAMVRNKSAKPLFYFARQGHRLLIGETGFESSGPISIHMKGASGHITSTGSEVTFNYPGITGVDIDGEPAKILKSGNGHVRVAIPAGSHKISLH